MGECFNKFFIMNGTIKEGFEFDKSLLKLGKCVYEVIRIIDGKALFLEEHLKRLKDSCEIINKKMIISEIEIAEQINRLVKVNAAEIGNVKIIFNYNEEEINYLVYFIKHSYPEDELYKEGVDTALYFGERTNPAAKVINHGFTEGVKKFIEEKKIYEAILVDNQGFITEGSRSNIFMVKGERVYTSHVDAVLRGITRDRVISIIKELGIDFEEQMINYKNISEMDGFFITGTSPKVLPIRKVDEYEFNSSTNDIINKIMNKYNENINKYIIL